MGLFKRNSVSNGKNVAGAANSVGNVNMRMANELYEKGEYGRAFEMFRFAAEEEGNSTAQYNLGSMYAQGLGTATDFTEAACWFYKAFKNGEKGADRMATKCLLDYANASLKTETPKGMHDKISMFVRRVYQNEDCGTIVRKNIQELGIYYFNNKKDYSMAARLFRAGAEYENEAMCQNYLAVLYNNGAGVEKNDLAALYWFDRAAEQGVKASQNDRNGILSAYVDSLGAEETRKQLNILADWCAGGTSKDVPKDAQKAKYWAAIRV